MRTECLLLLIGFVVSQPSSGSDLPVRVGTTSLGEPIIDCLLLLNGLDSDGGKQRAVVIAKRARFRVWGEVEFDRIGMATFSPQEAVLIDGSRPKYNILPLKFQGEWLPNRNAIVVRTATECATPLQK